MTLTQKLEALAEREAEAYADAPQPEHNDPWYEKHADYKAGHTSTHAMLIEAVEALRTVMNQPFNGDWDAQAVFVSGKICEIERKLEGGA